MLIKFSPLYISCLLCMAIVSGRGSFAASPEQIYPGDPKSGPKILLFTGGHSFDHDYFFEMFFSLGNFIIDTLSQPRANQSLLSDSINMYNVIFFYDIWQDINTTLSWM